MHEKWAFICHCVRDWELKFQENQTGLMSHDRRIVAWKQRCKHWEWGAPELIQTHKVCHCDFFSTSLKAIGMSMYSTEDFVSALLCSTEWTIQFVDFLLFIRIYLVSLFIYFFLSLFFDLSLPLSVFSFILRNFFFIVLEKCAHKNVSVSPFACVYCVVCR